jgi:hypothetical protein
VAAMASVATSNRLREFLDHDDGCVKKSRCTFDEDVWILRGMDLLWQAIHNGAR